MRIGRAVGPLVLPILLTAFPAPAEPPTNDAWENAAPLSVDGDSIPGTLIDATRDGSSTLDDESENGDVWYVYTATEDVTLRVNTCGTDNPRAAPSRDTLISVHSADAPGSAANELVGNDDWCYECGLIVPDNQRTDLDAALSVFVAASETVYVRVSHYRDTIASDFILRASVEAPIPAPGNDDWEAAFPIPAGGAIYAGTLVASTNDGGAEDASGGVLEICGDVWYSYTAPVAGTVRIDTCGTNDDPDVDQGTDTIVSVHTFPGPGTPATQLEFNDDWNFGNEPSACVGLDVAATLDSALSLELGAHQQVLIRVSHFDPPTDFTLTVVPEPTRALLRAAGLAVLALLAARSRRETSRRADRATRSR
ncbi:MAG: hypothetical protein JSU66_01055 [Deltaproteobacteria bacterium]|nr:MAG: hypothetical protein JSU66_01055 [Deltaproteobacteria bacterium]